MTPASARHVLNPLHAILLGFPAALFAAAGVCDITYLRTAEIQWSNFSAWLIAGGLLAGAVVVLWAIANLIRTRSPAPRGRPLAYLLLLAAMWVTGFVDALLHSRDAWYSVMATGLVLSIAATLLALAAAWIGHSGFPRGEVQ